MDGKFEKKSAQNENIIWYLIFFSKTIKNKQILLSNVKFNF